MHLPRLNVLLASPRAHGASKTAAAGSAMLPDSSSHPHEYGGARTAPVGAVDIVVTTTGAGFAGAGILSAGNTGTGVIGESITGVGDMVAGSGAAGNEEAGHIGGGRG